MLTADDTPTIRNAIQKRLDQEPGIRTCHVAFGKYPGSHIEVRVELGVGMEAGSSDLIITVRSKFHLPDPFEHSHLLNEIDQIAEGAKAARRATVGELIATPYVKLPGTGRRGLWKQYGLGRA